MSEYAAPKIKICGLTRSVDVEAAIDAGVHIIGLMFVPGSRRLLTLTQARDLAAQARGRVQLAGVFMDQPYCEVEHIVNELSLDIVQLHGGETAAKWQPLGRPLIKRVMPADGDVSMPTGVTPLIDPGTGSGITYSWEQCRLDCRKAFIAGGLTPDNVAEAILACAPLGVDVSSGVEAGTPGHKDPDRITYFVRNVWLAWRKRAMQCVST